VNNSIYIARRSKVILPKGNGGVTKQEFATVAKNAEALGFTFSKKLAQRILTLDTDQLASFNTSLLKDLKVMVGAHVKHKPMYPNFPKQVMEASEVELYLNAMVHYFGDLLGVRIMPEYKKERREKLDEQFNLKVIDLGTKADFESIFSMLCSSKTSVSPTDKEDISWFVENYGDKVEKLLPEQIPHKEVLSFVCGKLIDHTSIAESVVPRYLRTATDVLRLSVALSEGDVSLAENTKFKSMGRAQRRMLLASLENIGNPTEDMLRFPEQWKRLGRVLHPSEYKNRYPLTHEAFDVIRNDKPFETFNGKVEALLLNKEVRAATLMLTDRPGEFARKLDRMLRLARTSAARDSVIASFRSVAKKVSSPVLLQVMEHFKFRDENAGTMRYFFPKGNVAKMKAIKDDRASIPTDQSKKIVTICQNALKAKYSSLDALGNVYIDPALKNVLVPFSMRSASKALKTVSRGSKFDLGDKGTVRFFIWWKDKGHDRVDIDLSAMFLKDDYSIGAQIAYYDLRGGNAGMGCHSGDITSAPNGASEFIDININKALAKGARFIVMVINSYTQQKYCDLPECFAGFMMREQVQSGEIYDARTVENKFDVTSDTRTVVPLIIDLKERKVIWTDMQLSSSRMYNNARSHSSGISAIAKAMNEMHKPNLHELFTLHAKSRGTIVKKKEDAETIFSLTEGTTPFDHEEIISQYI